MLKSLELESFRCHSDTKIRLGSRLTFIAGPNGAGKTSLLDAIALLLAGANHQTTDSGQGIGDQVRDGQKEFRLAGILTVDGKDVSIERKVPRTGSATSQRLTVGGCQQSGKDANQEYLHNLLKLTPEVLKALTDSRTILSRPPNQQLAYLFKATGIAEITPTEFLVKQGVKSITSPGHLEALSKEHREINLRDLNRELKDLQAQAKEGSAAPGNPLEDPKYAKAVEKGATSPAAARKILQTLQEELSGLLADKAVTEGKLAEVDAALQNPAKPKEAKGIIAEDKYRELRDRDIPKYTENLKKHTKQGRDLTNQEAELRQNKRNFEIAIAKVRADIETLEMAESMDTCPTCSQKWPAAKRKQAEARLAELKAEVTASEGNQALIDKQIAETQASWKATEQARKFQEDGLKEMGQQVTAYEAFHQGAQGRTPAENQYIKTGHEKDLAKLAETITLRQKAIANWTALCDEITKWEGATQNAGQAKAKRDARQKELMQQLIPRENQVIEELEEIRTSLIQKHLEPFEIKLNSVLEKLGQPPVAYHLVNGWMCAGRKAEYLSEGQASMFFEAGFRLAVAETVGFPLVLLDNRSPLDGGVQGKLMNALIGSGSQVVMVHTTNDKALMQKNFAAAPEGVVAYWVSEVGGVSAVETIQAKEKAA